MKSRFLSGSRCERGVESSGDAGDQYTGLDRFGRLVDQRWLKTSDGTHRERVQYGFDRANNRQWRDNLVGTSNQDEYYTYDALYQLKILKRGNLNAGKTDLGGTPVWQEDWNYDPTGNWRGTTSAYVTQVNGTTTLDQNRSHDQANEILTLTGTPDWPDPTHDAAGNTTRVPQPVAPTSSYDCKFDAWDRLVEVKVTGGAVVSTLRYDGLKRRVTKLAGGNTRHYYYSSRWQVLEERLNALTTADRQFVWGLRHVDDLIERDRGSERFYVLHDHLSVTAIVNTTGVVQERYGYDGFGPQRVLDASFGARAATLYDWETGFGAYRLDAESGMSQVRHRYYHARLGRWVSRDEIEYLDGGNLYSYVSNGPSNMHDSNGLAHSKKGHSIEDICERNYPVVPGEMYIELGRKCYNRNCLVRACVEQWACVLGHGKRGGIVLTVCAAACCLALKKGGKEGWGLCMFACTVAEGLITLPELLKCNSEHEQWQKLCEVDPCYCS